MATEPVTHVVDARNIKDPVSGEANELTRQVNQLFGDNAPRETIRRAPIYNNATQAVAGDGNVQRNQPANSIDGGRGSASGYVQEDSRNAPDNYSGDYDSDFASVDVSLPDNDGQAGGSALDLAEFLRPSEQAARQDGAGQPNDGTQPEQVAAFEKFRKDFETYLGMPLESAVGTVQQLQQFQQQQTVETRLRQVADEWGVTRTEAEARMSAVDDRFRRLDPQTRAILSQNPIRGAQLIWQQLEREQVQPNIPQLDRSGGSERTAQLPRGAFKQADIDAMSNEEYRRRQPEILDAYRRGLVYKA